MNKSILHLALPGLMALFSCQEQPPEKTIQQSTDALRTQLQQLAHSYKAHVGLALVHIEKGDTCTLNGEQPFVMQSTYKFPLAIAVLQQVDKGRLLLTQKVHLTPKDLRAGTWSPLREKHPKGNIDLSLQELLQYTVSQSDNNTCDVLFRLVGGAAVVQQSLSEAGIKDLKVVNTEAEMAKGWKVQYDNWAKPKAMAELLVLFHQGKLLSAQSTALLNEMMTQTANSALRIKGALPENTVVAHKTGTSNTNTEGLTAATNDVGILTLPNGQHIALAVFVNDSMEPNATNEKIIALLSKVVFDYYNK